MNDVVVVTGGAKRIGASMVRRFHEAGYRVIVHCHQSMESANQLAAALNEQRENSVSVIKKDLALLGEGQDFAAACLDIFGRVVVLINNASVFYPTPLASVTPPQFEQIISTNLKAPLFLSKAFAPHLHNGAIINIVDIHANAPLQDYLAYSISKSGLQMLTKALALELAANKTRVNGVSPGAILWPTDDAEMTVQEQQALMKAIPLNRLGTPEDIAETALFLASATTFITGQVIAVDGGQSVSSQ